MFIYDDFMTFIWDGNSDYVAHVEKIFSKKKEIRFVGALDLKQCRKQIK